MSDIENLRQMALNLAARVGAIETIAETLLVVYGAQHGIDNLRKVTSWMLSAHDTKKLEEGPAELAAWLRQEELRRLRELTEHVMLGVEELQTGKKLVN